MNPLKQKIKLFAVDTKGFQIMMENISEPCHWNQSSAPGEGGPTSWEGAEEVYFYHSDHLGSASWITDRQGDAIQHLQYLPFGAPFVDQRASGYHERFTFTGKERDEETGYGYFGTRYMDHELMKIRPGTYDYHCPLIKTKRKQ